MRNIHHICFEENNRVYEQLNTLGFDTDPSLLVIDVAEDDSRWEAVARLAAKYRLVLHMCWSTFSDAELERATWLNIFCKWHHGYPQPENPLLAYMEATYDLSTGFCPECAMGAVQNRPFRLRAAPNWGTRHVMMLNWVPDAYFVRPDIWQSVFQPFGIGCWPVLAHKTGKELPSIVQLKIDHDLPGPLCLSPSDPRVLVEECPVCHRTRYGVDGCGTFPAMCHPPAQGIHLAQSQEFFGVGKQSHHEVFISHELYLAICAHKLKGFTFTPVSE